MSAIPPNFIGSAIQSADAQRKASESKEVDESRTASDRARQVARNEEMAQQISMGPISAIPTYSKRI